MTLFAITLCFISLGPAPTIDQTCWSRALKRTAQASASVAPHSNVEGKQEGNGAGAKPAGSGQSQGRKGGTHANPSMYVSDGQGGMRPATPAEVDRFYAEFNRRRGVIYQAYMKDYNGDREGALQQLLPILSEHKRDDDEAEAAAWIGELYIFSGRIRDAVQVVAPATEYSSNTHLLEVAAYLNCLAGQVAEGQIAFCKQDLLASNPQSGYSEALNLPNNLQTASFLANLIFGQDVLIRDTTKAPFLANAWSLEPGNAFAALKYGNDLWRQRRPQDAAHVFDQGLANSHGDLHDHLMHARRGH